MNLGDKAAVLRQQPQQQHRNHRPKLITVVMAFTDEALKAKLSTLNESQDSIVSVSQWIMFHR